MGYPDRMVDAPDAVPRSIGRYVLHGEIAAGGMATVHFGRLVGPAGFSRAVAIKRLHAQFARDPEFVAMFIDEARLAARISHPNVVPTLDVVAIDTELFLVMEYVRGAPLSRLIRAVRAENARIPIAIVASIVAGVLHGLHAAHEARDEMGQRLEIVHRDVSPQNILVGTDGIARVLDFGVAKAAGRAQTTRDGQLKGKLGYMAPEQLRGARATRQSDIFAASVVLWEALTGQRLFRADDDAGLLAKVLAAEVPPPSRFASDISPALEGVVLRGTASDPAARFPTASAMASALEAAIPVATRVSVGEWVTAHAKDELTEREARVAEIERSSGSLPTVASVGMPIADRSSDLRTAAATPSARKNETHGAPRPRKRRVQIAVAVVLAVGVGAGAALLTGNPRGARASGTSPEARAEAPAITSALVAVAEPPLPAPAPSNDSNVPSPMTTMTTTTTTTKARTPAAEPRRAQPSTAPSARAKPDCDPPSTTDDRGHVHFKPECF